MSSVHMIRKPVAVACAGFSRFAGIVGMDEGVPEFLRLTQDKETVSVSNETAIELSMGGVGGVYFLASPGELTVDLEKRDRNIRDRRTDLRALLVGPDRQVLQDATIPDDGRPAGSGTGPPQRARLSTPVDRRGIYGLNITVSQDRYGEEIIWGFRTNCAHYVIETARGHKDERRQEPIVLLDPGRPGEVCFVPRNGDFGMEISDLPAGVDALPVYDAEGILLHELRVNATGRASHTFPAEMHRHAVPWRLHLPSQQATIHIDGVTRWEEGDLYPNLPCWTPHVHTYFPLSMYRWMVTPYSRTLYGRPGEAGRTPFRIHNNSDREQTIRLGIEFPDGVEWPVRLSSEVLQVAAKETEEVALQYTIPADAEPEGERWVCHLRGIPLEHPDLSTYSTLILKTGMAPAARNLEMPIVLTPYRHENEQFGYLPDYPVSNQVYFDLENRPFVRSADGIDTWRDGRWASSDFRTAVRSGIPRSDARSFGTSSSKIAFDGENDLYLVTSLGRQAVLLRSSDRGRTFSAHLLEGGDEGPCAFDIEQFSGHNVPIDPPPILRYRRTASDERLIWRKINDLELLLPVKAQGRLTWTDPILLSDRCIGLAAHSGIPSSLVSRGPKVHVVWAEATAPEVDVPGVPTYVATYDRETRRLGHPVLIGYGAPPNDVHNSPSITMDRAGHLHVLVGTHGRTFQYARSLRPNDAYSGWTEAEDVWEGLRQTYVGLVCDPEDTLHLVFRLWWEKADPFPASSYATLSHQRKRSGGPWEEPRTLIVPPFSEYSIYYHRLTIDRAGRLFLSYDYWSTYWFYRSDHPGNRRALLTSGDGGVTWKLAETSDLL